jgi:hypothetical protein
MDINDGKEWDEADINDLCDALASGRSIEEAAVFLCRSSTVDDVRGKADELGLIYRSKPLPPPWPTHKISGGRLYEIDGGTFGVEFMFDDGVRISKPIGSGAQAEFAARDRIGDAIPIVPRPAP